jgi:hypothetical protein
VYSSLPGSTSPSSSTATAAALLRISDNLLLLLLLLLALVGTAATCGSTGAALELLPSVLAAPAVAAVKVPADAAATSAGNRESSKSRCSV